MSGADEFQRLVSHLRAIVDAQKLVALEAAFAATPDAQACPMPNEVHPAYSDKAQWIRDWLDGKYPSFDQHTLRLSVPRRAAFMAEAAYPISADLPRVATMTRKHCAGPAPYVGRPFIYVWDVAVDGYGRAVAADSRIEYR